MSMAPLIDIFEVKQRLDEGSLTLLDVREPFEREYGALEGLHIPMNAVEDRIDELSDFREKPLVVYCRSGKRSQAVADRLLALGFSDVKNMQGGILAWADSIDSSIKKY